MLSKLLRVGEGRMVKRLKKVADYVESLSGDVEKLTDAELRAKTDEFKKRHAEGESLDELLPEAFAVAREAAWRVLGQRPFEVQLMGAAALHLGNVAEMKTGEGKTLTSVLPAYLNGIGGKGVHIVTVNDYLAKRDSEWMGRVHRFLGLDVGVILAQMTPEERRVAYNADITYGTNNEFGFDYLRDNMAHTLDDCVQRGHNFVIVDEVDSILIDEARTPLIISGPADGSSNWYTEFARLAPLMEKDTHYEVDLRKRTVGVHELGVEFVEDQLGIDNLYEAANSPLVSYLNNALKAKELFNRDKDYIVRNGEVLIVDEFTGRVLIGRRYSEGMHQAIEAKEHVEIKAENQTLATITLQNYFRLYNKHAGMTGTAQTEAAELHEIYKLGVVPIPTNRPMVREDQSDLIYKTEEAKYIAVVDDVAERYEKGQPVLIGTTSVERSEYLSRQFTKRRIPHNVLNAKYHEQEAGIIAEAGRRGAITVATNMAGRGTDIVLGGNVDFLTDKRLRDNGLDPVETPDEYEQAWHQELPKVKEEAGDEATEVIKAGGLYVLGTERHESRRIDNQLRGRSGRQGDPGESRFYLSLGDELMRRFNGAALESLLTRLNLPDDVPIEAKMVTRAIKSAQTQVEQQNFEVRKNVLKYDEVMNQQRKVIYAERRRILEGENLQQQVKDMLTDVITAYVDGATVEGYAEDWDLDALWTALKTLYPVGIKTDTLMRRDQDSDRDDLTRDELLQALLQDADQAYAAREAELEELAGEGAMRQLERNVLLNVIDRKWREHLYEMDYLKEGIGLRAMAQRDPLVEYQREGYDMFMAMLDGVKEESVGFLFNVSVEAVPAPQVEVAPVAEPEDLAEFATAAAAAAQEGGAGRKNAAAREEAPSRLRAKGIEDESPALTYSGPSEDGSAQVQRNGGGAAKTPAGVPAGRSRRERREAARRQGRGAKPPKSVKKR
ncbi:preprotein translocase subunit SecA [Mycobacterium ulcerans]|uniref:Protein translocase subunit SecA 1 n=2 Tax=Mycobacterium ulcerans TaxID=1809 RepID=SECA1_MYCUA|nr:preprotein translocase subunit SecA [Mycobacterium ulcerans]A0PRE5.1 RecName: Full=Protein translocase subunit SecA 1 [Mycobacterium ulcerans Agy99]ABL04914.1 preprotein translocase SecA1 1 subunit [Mycobacterium ulcerans Agy99]MEB3904123.1 preprotein translocase subunit SecA [Mycobacterium ulcerans]MEB3908214.1 preprotein translocase subunit SecA [Mycobacterium ulcerans]MEB3918514.1 preprotein translocase subunit SecA [Mycobacterium ulcerans]MEB3922692.1 preprotein translocase subunit Sec